MLISIDPSLKRGDYSARLGMTLCVGWSDET
jgi:hypothetical protein